MTLGKYLKMTGKKNYYILIIITMFKFKRVYYKITYTI